MICYRDPDPKIPCMEYLIKTDIGSHFFIDPYSEISDDVLHVISMIGDYELKDDSNYFGIDISLVPDSIINQIGRRDQLILDKIKQNKIEETYNVMLERDKAKEAEKGKKK